MLHSIFFIGYINKSPRLTPSDFFVRTPEIHEFVENEFHAPFSMYKSHLPSRTPFSILLNMVSRKGKNVPNKWHVRSRLLYYCSGAGLRE